MMMSWRLVPYIVFFAQSVAGAVHRTAGLGRRSSSSSIVRALEYKHTLRVCNAYPYAAPLDLYRGKDKLTTSPMNYKDCAEFVDALKVGDKLDFRVLDSQAGTFTISDLPSNDAVLILMIHRHDTLSTAVSFESHVFAKLQNAQVAVIDTYKGSEKSTIKIQDIAEKKDALSPPRSEELRYDSVVAVNPGQYETVLIASDGKPLSKASLIALNKECYVVMRVGVNAQQGQSYPQELLVYPQSSASELPRSIAAHSHVAGPLALIAALVNIYLC